MSRYPAARWRPVARYQPGEPQNEALDANPVGVDHTYVGSPSSDAAFAHFNTPGTPIPHFMVFRDGSVDQYVDTKFRSSACLDGNHRTIAWETADGYPALWTNGRTQAPKDTPAMVDAKAKLMVWLHKEHGIPLVQMKNSRSSEQGFGWHRLGIDGNFETAPGTLLGGRVPGGEKWSPSFGKTCPTSVRIHQFVEETLPRAVELANPKPATVNYEDGHQSGRFDASTSRGKTMLARLADRCTVFAVTEAELLHAPSGYRAHGSESKVMWKMADWHRLDSGVVNIPTPTWKRGRSSRATVDVYWVLLRNRKTQRTLLRMVGHLPAHLFRSAQRQANLAALAALGGVVADLDKQLTPDAKTASFDLNRNLARQAERGVVTEAFTKTGLQLVVPPKATHGLLSKIDGLLSTDPNGSVVMFRRFPGFDHRGFRKASVA